MARSKDIGKEGAAAKMKKSSLLLARLADWPESWAIDDGDVPKGQK